MTGVNQRVIIKEKKKLIFKQIDNKQSFFLFCILKISFEHAYINILLFIFFSGPCMTLAITKPGDDIGEDLLPEFRSLIGPLDVNTAKEEAPSR